MKKDITIPGYSLKAVSPLAEYHATGIHLVHNRTGCEVFHILAPEDKENLFSFCFSTPSADNCGVAHILEHCVLSGSRHYPVRDPFLELMKGSLNTFLNAMTYPDRTLFPAASVDETDYFNLMAVYGDAVFFPRLQKEAFLQEGWRLEFTEEGTLRANGVVFNEMKGNYSSHDSIVAERSLRTLFPDVSYRFDSGGEPAEILGLDYERFIAYHRSCYHPSNCRIFLYGNIDTGKQCAFLDERFLSHFSRSLTPPPENRLQPRWGEERFFTFTSPLSENEDRAGKTTIAMNWLCGQVTDSEAILALELLPEILLGNTGCPLYKRVLDSGIGEDLSPISGIEADLRQLVFSVGIRGSEPERRDAARDLILGILRDLAEEGIPGDIVEGSLRRVEFRYREIKGGVPFGLRLLEKTIRGWNYGQDPARAVAFEEPFAAVRERSADPAFFPTLIRRELYENRHRSLVVVCPGEAGISEEERKADLRISQIAASLSEREREDIAEEGKAFALFMEIEDSEEAKRTIPRLSRSDLPVRVDTIPSETVDIGGVPCHLYDFFTNGVVYIDFAVDIDHLPPELVPFLPLYARAVCSGGLPGVPYDQVARSLSLHTGGFGSFLEAGNMGNDPGRKREFLFLRMKSLEGNLEEGFSLVSRLLGECDFSDRKHLRDLILEFRNDMKSSIMGGGNSYAVLRAGASLSPVYAREEQWRGIFQYLFLIELSSMGDQGTELAAGALSEIRRLIHRRERYTVGLCGAGKAHSPALDLIGSFARGLPSQTAMGIEGRSGSAEDSATGRDSARIPFVIPESLSRIPMPKAKAESLIIPSSVGYTATAFPAAFFRDDEHAGEQIVAALLRTGYLWERIRMRGGAYGAGAAANGTEGVFTFSSYRDPQPAASFSLFRDALRSGISDVDNDELNQAVIGLIGKEIHPMVPGEKAIVATRRKLYGITDEARQRRRDLTLAADTRGVAEAARRLLEKYDEGSRAVLAGKDQLDSLSRIDPGFKRNALVIPLA